LKFISNLSRSAVLSLVPLALVFASPQLIAQTQPAADQASRYVSDQLEITFRSGPGTSFAIRRMLKSGTRLEVVEENGEGYTRARLADGTTGWVLSRFLIDQPVARDKLAEIEQRMQDIREQSTLVEEKLFGLDQLEETLARLQAENEELQSELERLNLAATDTANIVEENKVLKQELEHSKSEQQTLIEENESLSDASTQNWFLIGAGVIILGMLIGLTIPNIRWKKRRSSMSGINMDF